MLLRTPEWGGKPLEELVRTIGLEPATDLDDFGRNVMLGDLEGLKAMHDAKLTNYRELADDDVTARAAATKEIYAKRWGPTHVPVFNLILLCFLVVNPTARRDHFAIAQWLINDLKVPVDGTDLSGSTALHHAITTKPAFEPEYAQILYDAGSDVNHHNRYGGTPAHEQVMTWDPRNREVVRRAADALMWFLDHGGNIDVNDTDSKAARAMVDNTRRLSMAGLRMPTWKVVDDEDKRRKRLLGKICLFCGRPPRGQAALLTCGACKTAKYCASPCQRGDWPHHKIRCKKVAK